MSPSAGARSRAACALKSLAARGDWGLGPGQGQAARERRRVFQTQGSAGSPNKPDLLQFHPPTPRTRAQPLPRREGVTPETGLFGDLLSPPHAVGGLQGGTACSLAAAPTLHQGRAPLRHPSSQRGGITALREKGNGKVMTQSKSNLSVKN